jgi:ribokinase
VGEVVVIGSAGMEYLVSTPTIAREGETVLASGHRRVPGGTAANQAIAAARMGANTTLIAALGDDEDGAEVLRFLRAEGLNTTGVELFAHSLTGLSIVLSTGPRPAATTIVPGANERLSPERVARAVAAAPAGTVVVLQAGPRDDLARAGSRAAVEAGHPVVLVAQSHQRVADELVATVAPVVIVQQGPGQEHGGGSGRSSSSPPVLTAAEGHTADAFVGALAAEIAAGLDLARAAERAATAAEFVSAQPDDESPFPTRAQLALWS